VCGTRKRIQGFRLRVLRFVEGWMDKDKERGGVCS